MKDFLDAHQIRTLRLFYKKVRDRLVVDLIEAVLLANKKYSYFKDIWDLD